MTTIDITSEFRFRRLVLDALKKTRDAQRALARLAPLSGEPVELGLALAEMALELVRPRATPAFMRGGCSYD
jgi:hypothetical protein